MQQLILIFITIFVLEACARNNVPSINTKSSAESNRSHLAREEDALEYLAKVEDDLNNSYKIFQSKGSPELLKKVVAQHQEDEMLNKKAIFYCKKVASERRDLLNDCLFFTKTFRLNKDTASAYQAAVPDLSKQLQLEDLILRNEITVNMKNTQNLYNNLLKSKCIYAQDYARKHQIYISTMKEMLDKGISPYN